MSWNNHDAIHRHASHAYEDFVWLRHLLRRGKVDYHLLHSISHHLRHVVYRSSHETKYKRTKEVRRASVASNHC